MEVELHGGSVGANYKIATRGEGKGGEQRCEQIAGRWRRCKRERGGAGAGSRCELSRAGVAPDLTAYPRPSAHPSSIHPSAQTNERSHEASRQLFEFTAFGGNRHGLR